MKNLNARAWLALAVLAVVMGLLLFVPAGTVHYWQAWVYLSIFTGASVLTTLYLMRKDPALLERRMSGGPMAEKQPAQKFIMLCTSIGFIALLVVPAFDHRFGWSAVPLGGVVAGDVLVAIGFYLISWCIEKTLSPLQPSKSPRIRRLFRPDRTQSFAIRCTRVRPCTFRHRRWRLARTEACPVRRDDAISDMAAP